MLNAPPSIVGVERGEAAEAEGVFVACASLVVEDLGRLRTGDELVGDSERGVHLVTVSDVRVFVRVPVCVVTCTRGEVPRACGGGRMRCSPESPNSGRGGASVRPPPAARAPGVPTPTRPAFGRGGRKCDLPRGIRGLVLHLSDLLGCPLAELLGLGALGAAALREEVVDRLHVDHAQHVGAEGCQQVPVTEGTVSRLAEAQ